MRLSIKSLLWRCSYFSASSSSSCGAYPYPKSVLIMALLPSRVWLNFCIGFWGFFSHKVLIHGAALFLWTVLLILLFFWVLVAAPIIFHCRWYTSCIVLYGILWHQNFCLFLRELWSGYHDRRQTFYNL